MKPIFLCLFVFLFFAGHTQKLLKGVVLDAEMNTAVSGASVFFNNTSMGTTANTEGQFQLYLPAGKYDLIVSSIGYETHNQTIIPGEAADFLTIKLKLKAPELETVVIEPYEKNGWEKWGQFFLENFIGTSAYARDCEIKNTGALRFRNSKKTNELTAFALEPLIIENKALGYTIRYQLESFSYNFSTHYLLCLGYPFFEPMKGGRARQKRWEQKRREVYFGSIMHFMRSVYRNQLTEEGFEVRALKKIENAEKKRVKEARQNNMKKTPMPDGRIMLSEINKDSAAYYNKIMQQPDSYDMAEKNPLPGDNIAYAVDSTTAGLAFNNYLLIIYTKGMAPPEYRQRFPKNSTGMMSQVTLTHQRPVEIQANGSYYNPTDLISLGYWAWSEKIATMLPFDFSTKK